MIIKYKKIGFWDHLKYFLGRFSIAPFEVEIIKQLKTYLNPEHLEIIEDQFSHYNRVSRVHYHDERLSHGFTNFYWIKRGKSQIDFPKRLPFDKDESVLAETKIKCGDNEISVKFFMIKGVLFSIEYRSPHHIYRPTADYEICDFKINSCLARNDT